MIKPYLKDFKPYPPGKPIEELRRELGIEGPIVKLASNENPFGPSPKAIEAIKEAAKDVHRYPDPSGYELKKALAQKLGVKPEEIVLGNGSNEVIDLLVKALLAPGDTALMSEPSFLMYEKFVQAAGGNIKKIPLKNLRHDLFALAGAIDEKTRLLFLDNPHNPTGSIIKHHEFESWIKDLPKNILIVLDEAYIEFNEDPEIINGLKFKDHKPPVAILRTFSKAYGLAGLRIGYGIMNQALADVLNAIRQPFNVNSLALTAAKVALEDEKYFKQVLNTFLEERKRLTEALKRFGLKPYPSQANFILVEVGQSGQKLYQALLRKGVIIRNTEAYGFSTCVRISIGTPEENDFFLAKLKEVLNEA
ncbi:histidinol-phosphate aminotransferase [Thermodesulfatator indicus DSM 15286]|uniref:Histidinol-phosphate aminotransferase n=1 Tax=Thermodesulfatator indicus (strain DSM 15286 / JCM 11887 / CIR29812) TaxID=667014 RepID=F8ADN9_THEID|nr:histidinol-phosphate transaminase [Thermodesulfatator indicus]AEH45997.1 histidinol-phosphate aminotransferase [Thermodesulfatator indicus DSM 15286]